MTARKERDVWSSIVLGPKRGQTIDRMIEGSKRGSPSN